MPDRTHTKYLLTEDQMPTAWYNIVPDLPRPPAPVLHPGTKQPVGPDDLAPLFPMELIMQEVSTAHVAWKKRWTRPPASITNTKASVRLAATSPILLSRRCFTTNKPGSTKY